MSMAIKLVSGFEINGWGLLKMVLLEKYFLRGLSSVGA